MSDWSIDADERERALDHLAAELNETIGGIKVREYDAADAVESVLDLGLKVAGYAVGGPLQFAISTFGQTLIDGVVGFVEGQLAATRTIEAYAKRIEKAHDAIARNEERIERLEATPAKEFLEGIRVAVMQGRNLALEAKITRLQAMADAVPTAA